MADPVPFNRAAVAPRQLEYVEQSFASARLAGEGPFTERARHALGAVLGTDQILLTPSCTAALEMSALLAGVGPGDEVIVPSFTFVSTANAYLLMGAQPVFADIDPVSMNIAPDSVASLVTERTRAIVPVHYGGRPCDMDAVRAIAQECGASVIEDAAHGLYASLDGTPLGRLGRMSTFSFHETKNLSCGEGGALVVNDPELWERACIIREKGTDRTKFMLGLTDKYTWVDVGSSYLLADTLAAIVLAQAEYATETQQRRRSAINAYMAELAEWAKDNDVVLPAPTRAGDDPAYHMMPLLLADAASRNRFLEHCRDHDVHSVFHYLPLHRSPMGERLGANPDSCPVTDDVSSRLARLPVFSDMQDWERDRVIEVVLSFRA